MASDRALSPEAGRADPAQRAAAPPPAWHTLDPREAAAALSSAVDVGLGAAEAARRLAAHGPNRLAEQRRRSPARMLFDQFADFMIVVLIGAAVVSGALGEVEDTVAIVVIVAINAVIGFVQEFRAERALAALKKMAAAAAVVVRDGERATVDAASLVPGDVVLLEAGGIVPADLRLVEARQLRTDESLLTGESTTVEKTEHALAEAELPLADRRNMAYKGSTVAAGRGRGVVVATGMRTELGRIAELLESGEEPRTPLQRRLAGFGRRLAIAVLAICTVLFVVGLLRGEAPVLMFLTAVSLAVAAIPEALPAVVTILLALGARRMVRERALVRRLPAVETLGSVTWVCSDKTGTLTQNRMSAQELFVDGRVLREWSAPGGARSRATLFAALALNNDAARGADGRMIGDPTETALLEAAATGGVDKSEAEQRRPRVHELPFDSVRKRMTTVHRDDDGFVAFTKGAPESVLPACDTWLLEDEELPIDREMLAAQVERMAADGLRVLAVAMRRWPGLPEGGADAVERGLCFVGLAGLIDPPRQEARDAVATCRTAGITPVMITGDHPRTALAIARRLGIAGEGDAVVTGAELGRMSEAQLQESVERLRVFARVDPAQKIRIVEALQARGQFVAMTGDGVNDAPALRRADIGVAMGRDGTDVAREASALVLLDDNFATIVAAVREGRRIYDNIRKFIRYAMTGNSAEIWTIVLAPLVGLPIPLLPIHILWVNLVTDGLPGLALAAEPAERGIMHRPPRAPGESLFAQGMWQHIVWVGLTMGGLCLATQAWAISAGSTKWQTMVFTVLTLSQMAHVLAIRSERDSLFVQGLRSNLPLFGAVALTFVLQMSVIYVPLFNGVFRTEPLGAGELGACLAVSSVVFFAVEVEKWVRRRGGRHAAVE
jgi:Ca2+-transporting ATPase